MTNKELKELSAAVEIAKKHLDDEAVKLQGCLIPPYEEKFLRSVGVLINSAFDVLSRKLVEAMGEEDDN